VNSSAWYQCTGDEETNIYDFFILEKVFRFL